MRRANKKVRIWNLNPALLRKLWELDDAWLAETGFELTITSGADATHGRGSLHYVGCAVDIRTWRDPANWRSGQHAGGQRKELLKHVQQTMGRGFDVVDEGDHFHIEYQPKTAGEMQL